MSEEKAKKKVNIAAITPILGLVFVFILFAALTGAKNFRPANLMVIVAQAFIYCILGIGAMFVYAYGGMDFNIGTTIGMASIVLIPFLRSNPTAVFLPGICVILWGLFSGFLLGATTQFLGLSAFIASLCWQYIWRGTCQVILGYEQVAVPAEFTNMMNANWIKVVVLVVLFGAGTFLLNRTRFGKYPKAIGGNPTSAGLAGVNVKLYIILAHMFSGATAGFAALFSAARAAQIYPSSGAGYDMNVLVACVLGGMPLGGGNNVKMRNVFIGSITVAALTNGLNLIGVNPNYEDAVKGIVFIVVVALSYQRARGVEIK